MNERTRHPAGERELLEEFAVADRDDDGRVDFAEFKALLEGLEAGMSEEEMRIGFAEVDADQDGLIDCREFAAWWSSD
ncbi:MAG TPA: EF-hand domain-containing protein [Steroidobacter sp.]|jgi:Ca2+-binding EF-hand superfamily protein|nr:EF-hand domain-containing protein [Steroidobacteraceae bacterium]HLS82376.1 EF-hand domain-containing protein [Steroidobacter sp.]